MLIYIIIQNANLWNYADLQIYWANISSLDELQIRGSLISSSLGEQELPRRIIEGHFL